MGAECTHVGRLNRRPSDFQKAHIKTSGHIGMGSLACRKTYQQGRLPLCGKRE